MNTRILILILTVGITPSLMPVPNPKKEGQGPFGHHHEALREGKLIQHLAKGTVGEYDYIQFSVDPSVTVGDSAYHALKNGYISLSIQDAFFDGNNNTERFTDTKLKEKLFDGLSSPWRSTVIKNRKIRPANEHIRELLFDHIVTIAEADQAGSAQTTVYTEISALAHLLPKALYRITDQLVTIDGPKTVTEKMVLDHLVKEVADAAKNSGKKALSADQIAHYMKGLKPISFTIESSKNSIQLKVDSKVVRSELYGPQDDIKAVDGDYQSRADLFELDSNIKSNPSVDFPHLKKDTPVAFLSSFKEDIFVNAGSLEGLSSELSKKNPEYKALFFILCSDKQWISCLIKKEADDVSLIVTDSLNKDRQQEPCIIQLAQVIKVALSKKFEVPHNSTLLPNPSQGGHKPGDKDEEAAPNYYAPLANVPTKEIPTLAQLFGEKIPNRVKGLINRLKRKELNPAQAGTALKNCLILYGPPGTGKTTIAQVIARELGWEMVFAGGGDFRTAYQGSGKAKIDALFAEAHKRSARSGKPVMVIIDEIDGMASTVKDYGNNQEDSRSMKSLITTLDQHRYNPNIFIMATSNYPEKLDPAVRRRFDAIKVPLPDLKMRQENIRYYLNKNGIAVKENDPLAITPYFFSRLASATKGFSPDAIGNMINTAAFDAREERKEAEEAKSITASGLIPEKKTESGFKPEEKISLWFRMQGVNFREKSLIANGIELLTLPLVPLFHLTEETRMAQHIYSQYIIQAKVMSEMKLDEASNHPLYRYEKFGDEPRFWVKETGYKSVELAHAGISSAVVGIVGALGFTALKYCWDKLHEASPIKIPGTDSGKKDIKKPDLSEDKS